MRSPQTLAAILVFLATISPACSTKSEAPIKEGALLNVRNEFGVPFTIRVDRIEKDPLDKDGEILLYTLSAKNPDDASWSDYCLPDKDGKNHSIPLAGYWNNQGDHIAQPDVITFACTNGVIAKCVRWGYKPWKTVNGISLQNYHQACTRMARADYCGDGRSHTRDGTLINLYDRLGIQQQERSKDLVFEAAWSPNGASYVKRPRYAQTLESLVAECPDRLSGRTPLDAPNLDEEAIEARFPETLLFNESRVTGDRL